MLFTSFDPSQFHDDFQQALNAVLQAKMAGQAITPPSTSESKPAVVDLMAALRASIDQAKAGRPPVKAAPSKKAIAKKNPPKALPIKKIASAKKPPAKRMARKSA